MQHYAVCVAENTL